ncbi:hypothetical protein AB4254_10835 [Vibrio breoganii]
MNKFVEEFRTRTLKVAKSSVKKNGKGIKTNVLRLLEAKGFGFQSIKSYERYLESKPTDCISAESLRRMINDKAEKELNSALALQLNDSLIESTKETICSIFYDSIKNEYSRQIHSRLNYEDLVIEGAELCFENTLDYNTTTHSIPVSPVVDMLRIPAHDSYLGDEFDRTETFGVLCLDLMTNQGLLGIEYSLSYGMYSDKIGIRLECIECGDGMYRGALPHESKRIRCNYDYLGCREDGGEDCDFTKDEFLRVWKEGRLFADISPDSVFNEDEMHPAIHFTLNTMSLVRQTIEDLFAFDHRSPKMKYGVLNLGEVVYKPNNQ